MSVKLPEISKSSNLHNNNNNTFLSNVNTMNSNATAFTSACAALGVKPNSKIVAMGDDAILNNSVIDLSNNYIGGGGFQALTVLLRQNVNLTRLCLAGNGLSNDSVVYFCRTLMAPNTNSSGSSNGATVTVDHDTTNNNTINQNGNNTIRNNDSTAAAAAAGGGGGGDAFAVCPNLTAIDLSDNPISLPAATALLQLVACRPSTIREITLTRTHIDPLLLGKISRCLNLGAARRGGGGGGQTNAAAAPANTAVATIGAAAPTTPYRKVVASQKVRAADIRAQRRAQRAAEEADKTSQMVPLMLSSMARAAQTIPKGFYGGFTVLNMAISTASTSDFTTELRMIYNVIVPGINAVYGPRYQLLLNPTAMYAGAPPHKYDVYSSGGAQGTSGGKANGNSTTNNGGTTNKGRPPAASATAYGGAAGGGGAFSSVPPAFTAGIIAEYAAAAAGAAADGSPSTTNGSRATATCQPVAIASDYIRNILKGNPFFVQLIGEKVGLPQYDTAFVLDSNRSASASNNNSSKTSKKSGGGSSGADTSAPQQSSSSSPSAQQRPFAPIAHREYEVGVATSVCAIAMIRAPTATMNIPPPLLPRLSDDPSKVHPDEHTRAIREAVATVRGDGPSTFFDMALERRKWAEHVAFVQKVRREHPSALLCEDYPAEFDGVDAAGNVLLKGLDGAFSAMLRARLSACMDIVAATIHKADVNGVTASTVAIAAASIAASAPTAVDSTAGPSSPTSGAPTSLHSQGLNFKISATRNPIDIGSTMVNRRLPMILAAAAPLGRKTITGKLDMYTITPPSRNMTLLHAAVPNACGVSTALRSYVHRLMAVRPHCIVAYHSTRGGGGEAAQLYAEPSDPRTLYLSLIQQLSTRRGISSSTGGAASGNAATWALTAAPLSLPTFDDLPSYIVNEVNIEKVKEYFMTALSRASGDAAAAAAANTTAAADQGNATPANAAAPIVVVVIDGLDEMDAPVIPCASLKISDTGANMWDPSSTVAAAVTSSAPKDGSAAAPTTPLIPSPPAGPKSSSSSAAASASTSATADPYAFIPICLPRNVRIIASCQSLSATHKQLEMRGHDSCDPLLVGLMGDYEVENFVNLVIRDGLGLHLSEATRANLIAKEDSRNLGYLQFIVAACERFLDTPTIAASVDSVVDAVAPTMGGACQDLFATLEAHFGEPFVRKALSLLLLSRWGLTEIEFAELMAKSLKGSVAGYANANANNASSSSSAGAATKGVDRTMAALSGDELNKFIRLLRPVIGKTPSSWSPNNTTHNSASHPSHSPTFPATNALENIIIITNKTFRELAMKRYVKDALTPHQLMAHYYHRIILESSSAAASGAESAVAGGGAVASSPPHTTPSTSSTPPNPLGAKAFIECAHHLIQGKLWSLLAQWVLKISFVTACYGLKVGYRCLRELITAYNAIDAASSTACPDRAVLLAQAKEYVYFARDHNVNLALFPHMGHQIAITSPAETFLHRDAKAHFAATATQRPHFSTTSNKAKAKTHRDAITSVAFAPNGARFATCSDDRSVKIFNASGGDCLYTINHSISKVKRLVYSSTSRYLVAVAEDRTVYVYDATNANLVGKFFGHNSIIRDVAVSCRGRYVATASDDRNLKIWLAETGALCVTAPHSAYAPSTAVASGSAGYGVNCVVVDPFDENVFYVGCHQTIVGWRMNGARDKCEEMFAVKAHSSQPIASLAMAGDGQFLISCVGYPAHDEAAGGMAAARNGGGNSNTNNHKGIAEASAKIWFIGGRNNAAANCSPVHVADLALPLTTAASSSASSSSSSSLSPSAAQAAALFAVPLVGAAFAAVSPDERTVAVAMVDGTVCAYKLDWAAINAKRDGAATASEGASLPALVIRPAAHFPCFANHPVIRIQQLVYSHDGTMLGVTGNARQLKVMAVSGTSSRGTLAASPAIDVASSIVAEYLLDAPLTAVAWSPNPQEGAPEIIIGDAIGRLHPLRLVRPAGGSTADHNAATGDK